MKRFTSLGILVQILFLIFATTLQAEETREQVALQKAEYWLSIVDSEKYDDSWDMAAAFFKNAVPKDQWANSMNAFRKPLGKMIERKLQSARYMTSLPGAPDGQYVVIQFRTAYENKKETIETVTPMLDNDGEWRVSGYFIK